MRWDRRVERVRAIAVFHRVLAAARCRSVVVDLEMSVDERRRGERERNRVETRLRLKHRGTPTELTELLSQRVPLRDTTLYIRATSVHDKLQHRGKKERRERPSGSNANLGDLIATRPFRAVSTGSDPTPITETVK